MRKKLAVAFIFLTLLTVSVTAQTFVLHGTITDSATGRPIASASVFLSNTSIGTSANANGEFTLGHVPQGRFDLVVSSLGYQTYIQSVTPEKMQQGLRIVLSPKANELAAVVVGTYEKDGWQKWGRAFNDNFIGTSFFATLCTIKNQDVIKFRYSKRRQLLEAFADEPIVVENRALGYIVHYKLENFSFDYKTHSLYYVGFPLFEEMDGNARKQKKWKERRLDAYYGSTMHFMRCLYVNKLAESGYEIRRLEKIPNTEKKRIQALYMYYVNPDHSEEEFEANLPVDTLKYYKRILDQPDERQILHTELLRGDSVAYAQDSVTAVFSFTNYLMITYKNKKVPIEYVNQALPPADPHDFLTSQVTLLNGRPIYVLYNGTYYEPLDMLLLGYWGWSEKIGSMLPFDYWPK